MGSVTRVLLTIPKRGGTALDCLILELCDILAVILQGTAYRVKKQDVKWSKVNPFLWVT